jgi:RND family efflux transporter MFP subunit
MEWIRVNPSWRIAAAGGIALTAIAWSGACSKSEKVDTSEDISQAPQGPRAVAVAEAKLQPMSHAEVLTAEFRPFQEVELMAKVAGYVKKINVDAGDQVQQGQVLAELEVPEMDDDLARAKAAVDRAQADVTRAKDEQQRAESAHEIAHLSAKRLADVAHQKPGLVAQQEVDDAHSKDLMAEAQLNGAKSSLTAAEQQVRVNDAEVKRVQTMLDYTRVIAPFAGVVTKRYADTGTMLQAGTSPNATPLVRLSQNSVLRLTVPVPESIVPTVHVGQQVEVHVQTLNRSFPGRVARFADKVTQDTRTMDTQVDVPNPSGVLIPGMFAEVNLTLDQRSSVLTIPIPAVDLGGDESMGQVTVVTADNKIEIHKVKLGKQDAANFEVLAGLSAGDRVVISNRSALRAGEEVRPKLVSLDSENSK